MTSKQHAPATARNREPILAVLRRFLPSSGKVLEIASGTGEHAIYFSSHLSELQWQPTDRSPDARESIAAWIQSEGCSNVLEPIALDVTEQDWGVEKADAIVCINMIHISPWAATIGLFRGASKVLPCQAPLYLYGPYKIEGKHTSESNARFEEWLHSCDPAFGVRDLGDVKKLAKQHGFQFVELVEMPANNFSVLFVRE